MEITATVLQYKHYVYDAEPLKPFGGFERTIERFKKIDLSEYEEVGTFKPSDYIKEASSNTSALLEQIYVLLNSNKEERPKGYSGHSLSVSDIIKLTTNESILYYYTDSIGFRKLTSDNAKGLE